MNLAILCSLFGMVSSRDPSPRAVGDLQRLGIDVGHELNHLEDVAQSAPRASYDPNDSPAWTPGATEKSERPGSRGVDCFLIFFFEPQSHGIVL